MGELGGSVDGPGDRYLIRGESGVEMAPRLLLKHRLDDDTTPWSWEPWVDGGGGWTMSPLEVT